MTVAPGGGRHYDAAGYRPRVRTARLHRSGNSYGLYIPKTIAAQLGLESSDEVLLYIVGRVLCIQPAVRSSFVPGVVAVPAMPPSRAEVE